MGKSKRHRLTVQYEILQCCRGRGLLAANITLRVNLSHSDFRRLSGELVQAGLLRVEHVDGHTVFVTSQVGVEFVVRYRDLERVSGGLSAVRTF